MTKLSPCPDCHRHVAVTDDACPFCGASTAGAAARCTPPAGKLTRAAVFASALAASAVGCGSSQAKPDDGTGMGNDNAAPAMADAGAMEQASPPPDAATVVKPDEIREEKIRPDHDIPMPYGAPPARKRFV